MLWWIELGVVEVSLISASDDFGLWFELRRK